MNTLKYKTTKTKINPQQVNKVVSKNITKYKKTIKMLEDYDKGKIQKPKDLARSSSVRTYLQQF
jgi:hypothetical protein